MDAFEHLNSKDDASRFGKSGIKFDASKVSSDACSKTQLGTVELPLPMLAVIDLLESAGYETWLVGGFVRDLLLERPLHDFDLTTAAPWQQVKELCVAAGYTAHETGTKHGTITVVAEDTVLEITTFRTEGAYLNHRHPSEVIFTDSIEEDLARRDFTVNAMAFHPARGILDPFGGQTDLRAGMIRCVGDANARDRKSVV